MKRLLSAPEPYAAAKVYAYWMARTYREGYGLFAANGSSSTTNPPEG